MSDALRTRPILLIDDNPDVRESLGFLLESYGYEVRMAADGCEGLAAMRQSPAPRVVLLDLHMPTLDGFGFRAQQMLDPTLMDIPVLLYSGHHDLKLAAEKLGIEDYFSKPLDVRQMLEIIERRCGS